MQFWYRYPLGLLVALSAQQLRPLPETSATRALDCVIPVSPHPIAERQPDGQTIELWLRGDGLNSWHEDAQGYPVVRAEDGHYVYARLDGTGRLRPTEHVVGTVAPQSAGIEPDVEPIALVRATVPDGPDGPDGIEPRKGAGLPTHAAYAGGTTTVKNLVLLLRFSDHGPAGQNRTLPPATDVDKIMNAPGGDPILAPTGSVNDHYLEMSYSQFSIDSTVVGWLTVPSTEVYYANGNSGLTSRTWELIEDGLDLADPLVDFSDFDEDGDGVVDAITFLHSGYGAEWGGTDQYGRFYTDRMWSHKWSIPTWTSAEGVTVSAYHISPGLWATSGSSPGRIGVVSHESGHFFGLPDLYDTDGSSEGDGNWCLMAGGSWGFDGSQRNPSHLSPWAKGKMGWVTPQPIAPGNYVAVQVETSPTIFKIDSGYPPGEYLLIENREPVGFDAVIPQGGLAIWHVDELKGGLQGNNPNVDEGYPGQPGWPGNNNHYRNALLGADGLYDLERDNDRGDAGDIYHGGGVDAITGATTPGTDAYQGGTVLSTGNQIVSIGAAGASVSFTYQNSLAPTITSGAPPVGDVGTSYSFNLTAAGGSGARTWGEFVPAPDYTVQDLGSSQFSATGSAQGWRADDQTWLLSLPFEFPYWERTYDEIRVSSNGFLDFAAVDAAAGNDTTVLRTELRIAPMWDDLRTDGSGEDIFVDTSISGQVKIRWDGRTYNGNNPVNLAVILFDDGRVRFDYGSGNNGLSPSIGISRGEAGMFEILAGYDGASSLSNASSILFTRTGSGMPPGLGLDAGGALGGTPTATGTWTPWVRVRDSQHRYDQQQLTITVGLDCNMNGVDDATDISMGTSQDCNSNGIPDECEADCDSDGVPDDCEADCDSDGLPDDCEADCDSDGTPDDCEPDCDSDGLPDDCEVDCNSNGTPDECESITDCNSNGIPDECDPDCDSDGLPDDCELDCDSDGTPDDCEPDCDLDGLPDDCEVDCNSNGTPDECESITDCNSNGIPDECDPDCDSDGLPDDCESDCDSDGTPDDCEPDCDLDGLPDDCEVDCNSNGTPDECESITDCNSNGIPDECDPDCDSDGLPDECESDCDSDGTPDDCEPDCDLDGLPDDCEIDCNSNGTPDECESITDCNANGIPDECDPDCDSDGLPDDCESDCDSDGTPDDCEPDCDSDGLPDDCEVDCNSNGTPDECESITDCNANGIPDECDPDCDSDGLPDDCESDCDSDGTPDDCEPDCDSDGLPDDCEVDCNSNGTPDECESITDCNSNGIPDECDPDCDSDGLPDDCESDCDSDGTPDDCEPDCDSDGLPDDCEIDCNSNGTPDECESITDCNSNGIPDECDPDCDSDGLPDDCELDCDSDGTPDDCEPDCDSDGLPDDCELDCDSDGTPDDCEPDCDSDGLPDDCEVDCNSNGTPDECESITDCNSNGIPDECDPDCDSDGLPDDCESDCDSDGTPDDCEPDCDSDGLPDDCEVDCNSNGTPDECESITDCNANGIPDECDPDCDSDGLPDDCESDCDSDGTPDDCEPDCDSDGLPDDCEVDCNSNGTPDECESITDCNANGIPDECDPDCDLDGLPDDCELDCDSSGVPDDCEALDDCDGSGVPDVCESLPDCDGDGVPDPCEADSDDSGIPDECEIERYCRAKRNSAGCLPRIGFSGLPSLSGDDDFVITATKVMGGSAGSLLWSLEADAAPFGDMGGTPFGMRLCLRRFQRHSIQMADGSAGQCDGSLAFAFDQADMSAAGLVAGMTVYAQIVHDDPMHPDGTQLGHTAALRFPIFP